jgi:hypothetical protein
MSFKDDLGFPAGALLADSSILNEPSVRIGPSFRTLDLLHCLYPDRIQPSAYICNNG